MTRLPRTIRLDPSDTVVFTRAAEPGEWAVPGTFLFWGRPEGSLSRKEAIAFRSGFLGVGSFGHSTLVVVQDASSAERAAMVQALAEQLVTHLGAPDIATALPAAEEEVALAESLCRGHEVNTLIALYRRFEGAEIREQFRTLKPRDETAFGGAHLQGHDRAFHFVEEEEAGDTVDLFALRGRD
ncbi:DUF6505 family protein [Pararhodobacter sp.]|uniref:DUF6505 family protein n=1 Tax=Pararhodobacter sp. TaxID=2127056 RepID=UPI002FDE0587